MYNDISNNKVSNILLLVLKMANVNINEINNINDLNGIVIYRETLLNDLIYEEVKKYIPELKKTLKTSCFTSTHKNANTKQNWPLINLVRQLLKVYNFKLEPKRIADGYNKEGIKKYKRIFKIINFN